MVHADVVTCFLRNRGAVLLARRSDAVGSYRGRWAGVSGYVEGDPSEALDDAYREIREEVGLTAERCALVRRGAPLDVVDEDAGAADTVDDGDADETREWTVHPFLFDVETRDVAPNEELAAVEWCHPTAMHTRRTVPSLWEAYRRVAPTLADVRDDHTHGSTYVSVRALEVLRDAASEAVSWDDVAELARDLRAARPAMAALRTRVDAVLADADRTPAAVAAAAEAAIDAASEADDRAAAAALDRLAAVGDGAVATLSRSGTVRRVLREADRPVVVGESRPEREGVDVAEALADSVDVTLATDAALPWLLAGDDPSVAAVVVGADAVLADGSVVNKTGTRGLALAAAHEGVPVLAVTAAAKVTPDAVHVGEDGPASAVYDGDAPVRAVNPTFDRTPADALDGVVTERGVLDTDAVGDVARRHAENARWAETGGD